jgi:hypothetical protein
MSTSSVDRLFFIWMTFLDGQDHAVRDENVVGARSGIYEALCGKRLLPASSFAAPKPPCRRCGAYVLANVRMRSEQNRIGTPPAGPRRHCRTSWWKRAFGGGR